MQPAKPSLSFCRSARPWAITANLLAASLLGLLTLAAPKAYAHGCPGEMALIDKALQAKPKLSPQDLEKVRKLRAEGEKLHKDDKHGESMLALGSAKKILGIQ